MFAHAYHANVTHRAADPLSTPEIAKRLKLTRLALGYTQPMMSVLAGLSTEAQAWSNYEQGVRRISIDVAQKLHTKLGITLHWIYRGEMSGLSEDLAAKIALQIRDEARKARR
jgi:transcriptional regulator with XRE-family HTH domain